MSQPVRPSIQLSIRPLAPYEPAVSQGPRAPVDAAQLVLPLPLRATARQHADAQAPAATRRAPRPPSERQLIGLLTALIEVAAGRRPLEKLRPVLDEQVCAEIRSGRAAELARGYAVHRVHPCVPAPRVVEVCATAVDRRRDRAVAVVARLEARWTGWHFTRFAVIAPPPRDRSGHASAA